MAGDWIKMRTNLDTDPAVVRIASGLKTDRYSVVGRLHKIWSWANEHLTDGQDVPIDAEFLDCLTEAPGFSAELRRVGWLTGRDGSLSFPSFERHNGSSAKSRAQDSARKKSVRKMSEKCPPENRTETGPEKRREEKSFTHTHTDEKKNFGRVKDARKLKADGFQEIWEQWCDYRLSQDGKELSPISGQAEVSRLAGDPEKAIRDITFSLRKGARSILDSDNDFEKNAAERRRQAGSHRSGKTLSLTELLEIPQSKETA
jgi:hypothetical protein